MNPGIAERIWYQSHVPIFLEKVVLPVLVAVGTAILLVNPMKFDWQSRTSLFVALLAFGYFVSHQLHLRNEAIRTGTAPTSTAPATPATGPVNVQGDCDATNTGNGGKADANCTDKDTNKSSK